MSPLLLLLLLLLPCVMSFRGPCPDADVEANFSIDLPEIFLRSDVPGEVYFREDATVEGLNLAFAGRGFEVSSLSNASSITGFEVKQAPDLPVSKADAWHGILGLGMAATDSMLLALALFLPGTAAVDCARDSYVMIRITYPPNFPTESISLSGLVIGAEDPAPSLTTPGSVGCEACPNAEVEHEAVDRFNCNFGCVPSNEWELTTDAAAVRFQGAVAGAEQDGYWYVAQTAAAAGAASGRITTNSTGNFSFLVPLFCGEQIVKVTWWNDYGPLVLVYRVQTIRCGEQDFRFQLNWDAEIYGHRDIDLHLLKPQGCWQQASDTFWDNMEPYWGAQLNVDCIDQCTQETITLRNASRQSGTYHLLAHYYGGTYSTGSASISICTGTCQLVRVQLAEVDDLVLVATIDGFTGEVTVVNSNQLTLGTLCPELLEAYLSGALETGTRTRTRTGPSLKVSKLPKP